MFDEVDEGSMLPTRVVVRLWKRSCRTHMCRRRLKRALPLVRLSSWWRSTTSTGYFPRETGKRNRNTEPYKRLTFDCPRCAQTSLLCSNTKCTLLPLPPRNIFMSFLKHETKPVDVDLYHPRPERMFSKSGVTTPDDPTGRLWIFGQSESPEKQIDQQETCGRVTSFSLGHAGVGF